MKPNFTIGVLTLLIFALTSCHSHENTSSREKDSAQISTPTAIAENRTVVKKEPAAEYKEKTDNPLNDWYFSVRLYETPKTFDYLLRMQFEEIRGEDTLTLPDLGIEPKPVIQKGKDRYSCIIGFLDKDNKFREYKMVYVKDGNQLKLVTLHHYSMVSGDDK